MLNGVRLHMLMKNILSHAWCLSYIIFRKKGQITCVNHFKSILRNISLKIKSILIFLQITRFDFCRCLWNCEKIRGLFEIFFQGLPLLPFVFPLFLPCENIKNNFSSWPQFNGKNNSFTVNCPFLQLGQLVV